jgi:hypothetical protein
MEKKKYMTLHIDFNKIDNINFGNATNISQNTTKISSYL